jgi:taurine dioxygenase
MSLRITPGPRGFGAELSAIDLCQPLSLALQEAVRAAWHEYGVVWFPDQPLQHADLERVTTYFGDFGDDPFVQTLPDHDHIIEVRRKATEQASVFGAAWHSDWSFLPTPPAATLLHAKVVPPVGGDTLFADGAAAFDALDDALKARLKSLRAVHSAAGPYGPDGFYAKEGQPRAMTILPSAAAQRTQSHPVVRVHPSSGRPMLFVNRVYTIAIEGMHPDESRTLLDFLTAHSTADEFVYRHQWRQNMLVVWDNRRLQHCATGGYDGHERLMHRTTVAGEVPRAA